MSLKKNKSTTYNITDNGKIECKKCNVIVNNHKEYEQHSISKKHREEVEEKTRKQIKDVKIINLVYSFDVIGYSIQFTIERKPRFRFLNALEQCMEIFDNHNKYVVFNCKGYKTFGFAFENYPLVEELTEELYKENLYTLIFYMRLSSKNGIKCIERL